MVVVVALNAAEVAAAVTVTDPGTVSVGLLFVSVTLAPPVGAALESVMVQVLEAFCPSVVGVHVRLVSVSGRAWVVALVDGP
jgi:hypothetical protein